MRLSYKNKCATPQFIHLRVNTAHPYYTEDVQHPQGLVQSAVMVVRTASSGRTPHGANAVPASASSAAPLAGPRRSTTTKTNTKAQPRPPPSRAAAFVPPLLSQEPHAGEPYREHVKVIPPSKERIARVIKQAHHKVRTSKTGSGRIY